MYLFLFAFFSLVFADGYFDASKSDLHPQFLVVIVTSLVFFKQNCIFFVQLFPLYYCLFVSVTWGLTMLILNIVLKCSRDSYL